MYQQSVKHQHHQEWSEQLRVLLHIVAEFCHAAPVRMSTYLNNNKMQC